MTKRSIKKRPRPEPVPTEGYDVETHAVQPGKAVLGATVVETDAPKGSPTYYMREQLAEALKGLVPTIPIDLADVSAVFQRVRPIARAFGNVADVLHDGRSITVTVSSPLGPCLFKRVLTSA